MNLWVWWSIGWTVLAALWIMRMRFKVYAVVTGFLVGALLPRALARAERFPAARRFALGATALALLCALFFVGARGLLPRPFPLVFALSLPALIAGLVVDGLFRNAQQPIRRLIAVAVVMGAFAIAINVGMLGARGWLRAARPIRLVRYLWPVAIVGLAVVPPRAWRRAQSPRSDLEPVLLE